MMTGGQFVDKVRDVGKRKATVLRVAAAFGLTKLYWLHLAAHPDKVPKRLRLMADDGEIFKTFESLPEKVKISGNEMRGIRALHKILGFSGRKQHYETYTEYTARKRKEQELKANGRINKQLNGLRKEKESGSVSNVSQRGTSEIIKRKLGYGEEIEAR